MNDKDLKTIYIGDSVYFSLAEPNSKKCCLFLNNGVEISPEFIRRESPIYLEEATAHTLLQILANHLNLNLTPKS